MSGVAAIADEAVVAARELFALVAHDREKVLGQNEASIAAIRLFEMLPRNPIVSVNFVIRSLGVSKPTAGRAIQVLEDIGILVEVSGKKRDRLWAYREYLDRLRVGTDLSNSLG